LNELGLVDRPIFLYFDGPAPLEVFNDHLHLRGLLPIFSRNFSTLRHAPVTFDALDESAFSIDDKDPPSVRQAVRLLRFLTNRWHGDETNEMATALIASGDDFGPRTLFQAIQQVRDPRLRRQLLKALVIISCQRDPSDASPYVDLLQRDLDSKPSVLTVTEEVQKLGLPVL
jgi:hypothetical protein